jgi:hypothetical protein
MRLRKTLGYVLSVLVVGPLSAAGTPPAREAVRYVRPSGDTFATECEFVLARNKVGWTLTSTTYRSGLRMEVVSRYDPEDRLIGAKAVLTARDNARTATVTVKDGKAIVRREGQESRDFDTPKGIIVTSAPDWSDVFLLCRRYDVKRKGKQVFPALWIHPTAAPQRLTFTVEWQGTDAIVHDGRRVELYRLAIRIRDNSAYVAWADAQGGMVRLIPLPAKATAPGLTRAGFEKAAAGLAPPAD